MSYGTTACSHSVPKTMMGSSKPTRLWKRLSAAVTASGDMTALIESISGALSALEFFQHFLPEWKAAGKFERVVLLFRAIVAAFMTLSAVCIFTEQNSNSGSKRSEFMDQLDDVYGTGGGGPEQEIKYFVSLDLLMKELGNHEILECWTMDALGVKPEPIALEKLFLDGELLGVIVARVGGTVVRIVIDTFRSNVDFNACDGLTAITIANVLQKNIISSLKHGLIQLSQMTGVSGSYREGRCILTFQDLEHHYDNRVLIDSLKPVVDNALSRGIKVGILVHGVPGVGKTLTVKKLLHGLDAIKIKTDLNMLDEVRRLLASLSDKRILVIDDADLDELEEKNYATTRLLELLDSSDYNVAILIMNELNVHPTITRAGRCDYVIHALPPALDARKEIISNLLKEYSLSPSADLDYLAASSEGFTHAEINSQLKMCSLMGDTEVRFSKKIAEELH